MESSYTHIFFLQQDCIVTLLSEAVCRVFPGRWQRMAYPDVECLPVGACVWMYGSEMVDGKLCDLGYLWAEALKLDNFVIIIDFDRLDALEGNPVVWNPSGLTINQLFATLPPTLSQHPRSEPLDYGGRSYYKLCSDWFNQGSHQGPGFEIGKLAGFLQLSFDYLQEGDSWLQIKADSEKKVIAQTRKILARRNAMNRFLAYLPDRSYRDNFAAFFADLSQLQEIFTGNQPPDISIYDPILMRLTTIQDQLENLRELACG